MTKKRSVDEFFKQEKWAFVGATNDTKKFGHFAFKDLLSKGIKVVPVNPNQPKILELTAYPSLSAVSDDIGAAVIAVNPSKTLGVVKEAYNKGIRHIWMQQGAESDEAVKFCQENGINYIAKECILMFAEPVGFPHSFHRLITKVIGKYPK